MTKLNDFLGKSVSKIHSQCGLCCCTTVGRGNTAASPPCLYSCFSITGWNRVIPDEADNLPHIYICLHSLWCSRRSYPKSLSWPSWPVFMLLSFLFSLIFGNSSLPWSSRRSSVAVKGCSIIFFATDAVCDCVLFSTILC